MSASLPSEPPPRNAQAAASHRKQTFWQITFPFLLVLLAILLLIAGVIWSASSGTGDISRWADVALIWQMPLPILLAVICLVANIGLAFGLFKLIEVLPGFAYKVHQVVLTVQAKVNQFSDLSVEPILRTSSFKARLRAFRDFFRRK